MASLGNVAPPVPQLCSSNISKGGRLDYQPEMAADEAEVEDDANPNVPSSKALRFSGLGLTPMAGRKKNPPAALDFSRRSLG